MGVQCAAVEWVGDNDNGCFTEVTETEPAACAAPVPEKAQGKAETTWVPPKEQAKGRGRGGKGGGKAKGTWEATRQAEAVARGHGKGTGTYTDVGAKRHAEGTGRGQGPAQVRRVERGVRCTVPRHDKTVPCGKWGRGDVVLGSRGGGRPHGIAGGGHNSARVYGSAAFAWNR